MAASGGMWIKRVPRSAGAGAAARRVFLSRYELAGTTLASRGQPEALERWGGGAVSYDKAPHPGQVLNGVPLASAAPGAWKDWQDQDYGEDFWDPWPENPHLRRASGAIILEPAGRVWIYEPFNHYGGYAHSFPKGGIEPEEGLSAQQNAIKEVFEETGLRVEITGYLGSWGGDTSQTRYYLAKRVGRAPWDAHWEAYQVKLTTLDAAGAMLNRKRDREIINAVAAHLGKDPVADATKDNPVKQRNFPNPHAPQPMHALAKPEPAPTPQPLIYTEHGAFPANEATFLGGAKAWLLYTGYKTKHWPQQTGGRPRGLGGVPGSWGQRAGGPTTWRRAGRSG